MSPKIILIVDDNEINLKLMDVLLSADGYIVEKAEGAEQALTILAKKIPDLILMDIQLPGIDGMELTRRIRLMPQFANTKIIAITALARPGDEKNILEAGCDGYIPKPIDIETFSTLIQKEFKV